MPYIIDADKPCCVAPAQPTKVEREGVDHGEVRLPIALRDNKPLTIEEAEEIRRILDDPTYPTHAGTQVALADEDVIIKR